MNKKNRLRKREEFSKVYNRGKSFANRELVIYIMENIKVEEIRVGISVSKKVGNAVTRNRIKRIIKEILYKHIKNNDISKKLDIIIIARIPTAEMNYSQFNRSIEDLLKKSKLKIKSKN